MGLAKLSRQLPPETKQTIIEGLVHPHIIYCLTVWGSCSKTQKYRIQKALNFGARIITGLKRSQHISPALKSLGWFKVDELLTERDLVVLYQTLRSPKSPDHLRALVSPRANVSDRTTRGSETMLLQTPRVRTELARRSFLTLGTLPTRSGRPSRTQPYRRGAAAASRHFPPQTLCRHFV